MAGANDIIAYGFGSWSTVAKLPTLGFSAAAVPAATSEWHQCAEDIKTLIAAMGVDEWTTDTINIQKQPWDRPTQPTGGVILSPAIEKRLPMTNKKDETQFGILVSALIGSNQDVSDATELSQLLTWRQTLRDGLLKQTTVGNSYDTELRMGRVVIDGAFRGMFDVTQLVVLCKARI